MKSILLFLFTLLSINLYSQKIEVVLPTPADMPMFYVVQGDTIGLILSIEQAQKIDNDLEIKKLLETSIIKCDSLKNQYVVVIDKMGNTIATLTLKVSELESISRSQTNMINELKSKISNYEKDLSLCDEQSKTKDQIIKNQKKDINKLKRRGGAAIVVLTTIIGFLIF